MKISAIVFVFMFIFMSSFALAEISISPPSNVYNFGDKLYTNIDGLRGVDSGNLNINLVCGNTTTNLVRISARSFSADEDQSYRFYKILNEKDLGIENLSRILGNCQIMVLIGDSAASTKTFSITNKVKVSASLNREKYNPGETIIISVHATKNNGHPLNGFVVGSNSSDFKKVINDGFLNYTFSMPDTTEPGTYYLNIDAYDVGANGILNEGKTTVSFKIKQIVSSVVMSLSDTNITPGGNLTIGANVFDQSGKNMSGLVAVQVVSPENKIIKSTIQNGKFEVINFPLNSTAGKWKIISSLNGVSDEREFDVPELQKVNFSFAGSVLSIKNIGNVIYNKTIDVKVGNSSKKLELNIAVGEVRKFNLKAPNGKYEVAVGDGNDSVSSLVLLTGNAISVSDLKDVGVFSNFSIVWIFLIIVLGGIVGVLFMRYRKTKLLKVGEVPGNKRTSKFSFSNKFSGKTNFKNEKKKVIDLTKKVSGGAESALVLKGEKYMSSVVALSIRNYSELNEMAKETLHKIVDKSQKNKGLIDFREEHIFIVFSPLVTKTYNNEILSAKTGMDIFNELNEYNRKFKSRIKFNIGIHAGYLISSKADGKLKYTSIGNTISLTKRIADSDSGKLIASETIRKKIPRELKVSDAREIAGNKTYEISEIKDKSADAARLKDLLKRMD